MKVIEIAFSKHVGIEENESGELSLPFHDHLKNHLGTLHAGAQYVLAETASGAFLQQLFPELAGEVVAVLRSGQAKYKSPATDRTVAYPSVDESLIEPFRERLKKKGRALIDVKVELKNVNQEIKCVAIFRWFVTNMPEQE